MKRLIYLSALILCTFCILFTGCKGAGSSTGKTLTAEEKAKQQISSTMNNSFETTANISYNGVKAVLTMGKEQTGNYKLVFTEPDSLSGVSVATEGEQITIVYKDMSMSMTSDEFFSSSVVKMIIESVNQVSAGYGLSIAMGDEKLTVTGSGETGEFMLVLDPKNSNLMSLEIPSNGLSVEFENFKFLN